MNRPLLLLAAAAALVATPAPLMLASAHDHGKTDHKADQIAARAALARGEILPIARILGIAAASVPGDVLEVELERKRFGFQYEVKILASNGRVREVEINARTGAVLSIEDD